jgi:biopolymer transport protein ExbD
MQIQGADKPYDDINITPMLDLAYVLLVIFIIMTTASVQGAKVDLPKGSATQSLAVPKTKVVAVSSSGQLSLDAVPVSLPELEHKLRDLKAITPDLPVVIKGDQTAQYGKVAAVLDLCQKVGIGSVGMAFTRVAGS